MTDDRGKRRLRAKPAALAARGRCDCGSNGAHPRVESCPPIAEGTQPGTHTREQIRDAMKALDTVVNGRTEIVTAERDRAIDVVDQLERIITAIGGYIPHADQQWLREARALLVQHGRRAREDVVPWVNRS